MTFASRVICVLFAYLYPAYYSFKALKSNDTKSMTKFFILWITMAIFNVAEFFGDALFSWVPLYYELKTALVVFLIFPEGRGALYMYKNYIHPYFLQNEERIDLALQRGQTNFISFVYTTLQKVYITVFNAIHESIQKGTITFPVAVSPSYGAEGSSSSLSLNTNQLFQSFTPKEDTWPGVNESLQPQQMQHSIFQSQQMHQSQVYPILQQSQVLPQPTQPQMQQSQMLQQPYSPIDFIEDDDWEMPADYETVQSILSENQKEKQVMLESTPKVPELPSDISQMTKRNPKNKKQVSSNPATSASMMASTTSASTSSGAPTTAPQSNNPLNRSISEPRTQVTKTEKSEKPTAPSSSSGSSWWFW